MQRFLSVLLIIVIILLSSRVYCSRKEINDMFNSFEVETTEQPAYVCYNTLTFKGTSLNFKELLQENEIDGVFHEVYVIQNDTVWFGYSDAEENVSGSQQWHIASVAIGGDDLNVAYSGVFCTGDKADQVYRQNNNSHKAERYLNANGFYDNGKIILTDHVKTIEFDLATVSYKEISTEDYDFPTLPVQVEILDYETITFCKDSEQKTFSTETGKTTSKAFKKLMKLKAEKNWQKKSYLSELFDKVQIVNDRIYMICKVFNWEGETHTIVFQYNFEKNDCQYAFHCFMDDDIDEYLYIVPTI